MGQYSKKGLYSAYDKNHKERDALDYYATPPEEVLNILRELNIDFNNQIILEPCAGGGHMVQGIKQYIKENNYNSEIIATDVKDRGYEDCLVNENTDFISDDYLFDSSSNIDYIIMNPPYKTIVPFTIRALEIAHKGVVLLGRLQYLETKQRFLEIFDKTPPTDVYVLVDRIACHKGGVFTDKASAIQAYCWCFWDKTKKYKQTTLYWLRRFNENGGKEIK